MGSTQRSRLPSALLPGLTRAFPARHHCLVCRNACSTTNPGDRVSLANTTDTTGVSFESALVFAISYKTMRAVKAMFSVIASSLNIGPDNFESTGGDIQTGQ